jgi:uncharacterized protein with von Willebrand factor type A (vWA) domain
MLGDARSGKLADNLTAFGRALRRAGVPVDSSRIVLAQQAAQLVGVAAKADLGAALEAVMVSREQDRLVFRELFESFFRNPEVANKLLSQMLPSAEGKAEPAKRRPRVREALAPQRAFGSTGKSEDKPVEFDAAMTASDAERLRQADFNQLSAGEYRLVERLVREIALPWPRFAARRTRPGVRGATVHWPRVLREAARAGGEPLRLLRRARMRTPHPLLVLVDVSGSMERYARLLLAFLHVATRSQRRREVFAFGTQLTELTSVFRIADTDAMLAIAGAAIHDFAGGTRLGASLRTLHEQHARKLVGRRTLVLLVTDGLDTGEGAVLEAELQWLKRHSARLLWLNPLLRFDGYAPLARGASVLHRHADAMLAVHNLSRLEQLAQSLSDLMRTQNRWK